MLERIKVSDVAQIYALWNEYAALTDIWRAAKDVGFRCHRADRAKLAKSRSRRRCSHYWIHMTMR